MQTLYRSKARSVHFAWLLVLFVVALALAPAVSPARGQSSNYIYLPAQVSQPSSFAAVPLGNGFDMVTSITNAGDDRLFVVERSGIVKILHPDGRITTFLDISERVLGGPGEFGMFDLDFHPDYLNPASPGFGTFFVSYTSGEYTSPDKVNANTIVSRFRVSADPDKADPASEVVYLSEPQQTFYHNGGGMDFDKNTDMLYVGIGDDRTELLAQDDTSLKGKVLRLEVDNTGALPRVWGSGFRNPWRIDVDEPSGQVLVADVGEALWEEVNLMPVAAAGGNYGWPCMEGPVPNPNAGDIQNSPLCQHQFELPIYTYTHVAGSGRCAIIGGAVFRPWNNPTDGRYVFGDMCSREVMAIRPVNGTWESEELATLDSVPALSAFGQDRFGNLYLGTLDPSSPIYRLYIP